MQSQRLEIPLLGNEFQITYGNTRSFKSLLPSNKTVTLHHIANRPRNWFLDAGITHLGTYTGGLAGQANNTSLFISNGETITQFSDAFLGGKNVGDFTEQECYRYVDFLISQFPNIQIWTGGLGEFSPAAGYKGWLQPSFIQQFWINKDLGVKLQAKGFRHYGDYDGHTQFIAATSDYNEQAIEVLRPGLSSPSAALAFFNGPGATDNGYYNKELYKYRHGLTQTYWNGTHRYPGERLMQFILQMQMSNKARQAVTTTFGRLMSFMWAGRSEAANFQETYRHNVNGGQFIEYGFPQYGVRQNLLLAFYSLVFCDDLYSWEEPDAWGLNPNIVPNDIIGPNGEIYAKYYGPGNPTRGSAVQGYNPNLPGAWPSHDMSPHDYVLLGCEYYAKLSSWAGQNFQFTKHRLVGGTYCSDGDTYVLDRYLDHKPMALVNSSGNKRGLSFYDSNLYPPGTSRTYEIDILGATYTLEAESGVSYFFAIDLS